MGTTNLFFPLMVVMLSNSFMSMAVKYSPNLTTDQTALLALKARVTQDPRNLLATNWSSSTSICNWIGVTCGSISNHEIRVTALNLSHMGLTGTIPPHLGNLSFLSQLELRFNRFHGSIPMELANLSRLTYINFGNNSFGGEIPSWFGSFTQLKSLFLYRSNFFGVIPSSLGSLSKLEKLLLYDNDLEGEISTTVFGNLSNLKWLYLNNNQLSGQLPSAIFEHLPELQYLDLSLNHLNGVIPTSLFKCQGLEILILSSNSLEGSMSPEFENLTRLSWLHLKGNNLTGVIPSTIGQMTYLTWLDLSFNNLRGRLPNFPPSLRWLSVSRNKLVGEIHPSIFSMARLKELDLSKNNLGGIIPECIGNFSSRIVHINLRTNKFDGTISGISFPKGCLLSSFRISMNQIEGLMPRTLVNCKDLELVDFGNNSLYDTFPGWLGNLNKLQVLALRSNRFHGQIDHSEVAFSFPQLRIIDVSQNDFSGYLPTKFLANLHGIRNGYEMKGEAAARYMTNVYFYADHDDYYAYSVSITTKGLETEVLRILTAFTVINFSNNRFNGQIPEIMGELHSLIALNLSHNSLTGPIPASLANLSMLESLDLSSNKLQGRIPVLLKGLGFLAVLNLSWNNLTGSIPQGKQFDTFSNDSYIGNLGLCGLPLSKACGKHQDSKPLPKENDDTTRELNWKFSILMGYGCGLVFGLSTGYIVFTTGKPWWFIRFVERVQQKYFGRKIGRHEGRKKGN